MCTADLTADERFRQRVTALSGSKVRNCASQSWQSTGRVVQSGGSRVLRCQVFLYEQDASKRPIVRNVEKVVGSAKIMIRNARKGILYCKIRIQVKSQTHRDFHEVYMPGRVVLICLRDRQAGAGQKCVVFGVRNRLGTDPGPPHTVKQKVSRRVHPTGQAGQAMGRQRNSPKTAAFAADAADAQRLQGFIKQLGTLQYWTQHLPV
ncbi:hypothetical protein EDB83DRAFT_2314760 [Lactarius deliciosus]|nr:hypothetical protein EDB83DRAFT_2314760 [Lactarius deliciosus]